MKKTRTITESRGFVLVSVMSVLTSFDLVVSLVYLWKKRTLPALALLAELRGAFDPTCGTPGPTWGCGGSSSAHAELPDCNKTAAMTIKKIGQKVGRKLGREARLSNRRYR